MLISTAHRRFVLSLAAVSAVVGTLCCVKVLATDRDVSLSEPGGAVPHADTSGRSAINPLARRPLYVDSRGPAADEMARRRAEGQVAEAALLAKIADRPVAAWVTDGPSPVAERVGAVVGRANAARQLPLLVAYNIPDRDCGGASAGGAATATQYREWIRAFARGIDNRPAVVILEPDAIAHTLQGCVASGERFAVLRDAVSVLKATGSASVYLDAGNPGWITDPQRLATALRSAGIDGADGFALNVANFYSTADNIAFGNHISEALGGHTHFVIDTSRNGNGPAPNGADSRWCNPPGRALGQAPTTATGQPRVDAFLWVKRPGESDGSCRPGEPPAGQWWPQYALGLATHSS